MKEIKLDKGYVALVDDEDYERLCKFGWYAEDLPKNTTIYVRAWKNLSMHRVVMSAKKGDIVDHKDHNGLNNQKSNLRICNIAQSNQNRRKPRNTKSLYKGVSYQAGKYKVQIRKGEKLWYLGRYKDPKIAAEVYNLAVQILNREYSCLNII